MDPAFVAQIIRHTIATLSQRAPTDAEPARSILIALEQLAKSFDLAQKMKDDGKCLGR